MVKFPDIDPVALAIGPLQIRWYALAYLAGFLLGWAYGLYITKRDDGLRPNREDIDDFMPWAILGVILGGRFGYVLFYQPGLYLSNPVEIMQVWHGGMSFHGGALGVIVALLLFSWSQEISPRRLADVICAAVPIGLFFGRLANFVNGELFGRAADPAHVPWAMIFPRGGDIPRHPSQLYEAGLEGAVLFLVLLALVHIPSVRRIPGVITGVFLCGYGAARFTVEYFREPDFYLGLIGGVLSMGQLLSLPMILLGVGVIVFSVRRKAAS